MSDALVLFDGTALVYRAFYGGARWDAPDGAEVGGLQALTQRLASWIVRARSRAFAVVFDPAGDSFRKELDPAYKAHRREPPPELPPQLARAPEVTRALGVLTLIAPGYEADDLMATAAVRGRAEGHAIWLVSPDKDVLQLVDDADPPVRVFKPFARKVVDAAAAHEILGVPAARAIDYFALTGDASDGVRGVPGVGPKAARALIGAFGDLDGVFGALDRVPNLDIRGAARLRAQLEAGWDAAELSRRLVTLATDAPLGVDGPITEAARWSQPRPDADAVFRRLGFEGPLRKLRAHAATL